MSNSLSGFIAQQESRGVPVTPEIRQVAREIEERKEAKRRYENRPLRCKLGLHSRVQSWSGGGYLGTCEICWRHKL